MKLSGDLHTHPIGHILIPDVIEKKRVGYQRPEVPSEQEVRELVKAFVDAAVSKGLDFFVTTDHQVNTGELAQRYVEERGYDIIVILGMEVVPASTDIYANHVILAGVKYAPQFKLPARPTLTELQLYARAQKGIVICAPPHLARFFYRGFLRVFRLWDAYEGWNGSTEYAYPVPLPRVSVTDAHSAEALLALPNYTVVDADEREEKAILRAIKEGRIIEMVH